MQALLFQLAAAVVHLIRASGVMLQQRTRWSKGLLLWQGTIIQLLQLWPTPWAHSLQGQDGVAVQHWQGSPAWAAMTCCNPSAHLHQGQEDAMMQASAGDGKTIPVVACCVAT